MVIDFSTITIYEVIALILSFIAIMIPIVQWAWNKWIVRPVLRHIPTGKLYPCFNAAGSYLRIESVYEALHKPITVKNIALRVTRLRDDVKLNLKWASFPCPVSQTSNDNFFVSYESAHPFRIERNSVVTAFTEFEDPDHLLQTFLAKNEGQKNIFAEKCINEGLDYNDALKKFKKQNFYKETNDFLTKCFFWYKGEYKIELIVKYEEKEEIFSHKFKIGEIEHDKLMCNLDETCLLPLKKAYKQALNLQWVTLQLDD
jgi:hypothetical protein